MLQDLEVVAKQVYSCECVTQFVPVLFCVRYYMISHADQGTLLLCHCAQDSADGIADALVRSSEAQRGLRFDSETREA